MGDERLRDERAATGDSWLGQRFELRIGAVAHGGHCVARHLGRVLFVRHCLPGELVLAEVTEDRGGSFCRADAIEVREPALDRVRPPCRYAHPGGCGGCDFQHVTPAGQRALKAAVVAEQLSRLAGIERRVTVEALSPDDLGWRRRMRFAVDPTGRLALHRHRSSETVAIDECLIGAAGVSDAPVHNGDWNGLAEVEFAVDDDGRTAQVGYRRTPARGRQRSQLRAVRTDGAERLHYRVGTREFAIEPAGFWQTHPQAAERFTATVLAGTGPRPGERVLDLYAGAGLFTAALAGAVGPSGRVLGLEGDPAAVTAAEANLADLSWATVRRAAVTADTVAAAAAELGGLDLVVLDPPRTGAGGPVLRAVLAAEPRVIGYVACDPAALARDLSTAREAGWELVELSAFDAFPMTHHVECIAMLRRRNTVG